MNRITKEYFISTKRLLVFDKNIKKRALKKLNQYRENELPFLSIVPIIKGLLKQRTKKLYKTKTDDSRRKKKRYIRSCSFIMTECQRAWHGLIRSILVIDKLYPKIKEFAENNERKTWKKIKKHLNSPCMYNRGQFGTPIFIQNEDELYHVYFFLDKVNNIVKIGASKYPPRRVGEVSTHCGGAILEIIHVIYKGGFELEAELHKRFESLNNRTIHPGVEWFNYTLEIQEYIKQLK